MLLCVKCLDEIFVNFGIPVSYGRCEYCKEPKECADIPSKLLIEKDK